MSSALLLSAASFTIFCDNIVNVSVSQDNGGRFSHIGSASEWTDGVISTIRVTNSTILRANCRDSSHNGGFIATVIYNAIEYSTLNPLNSSNWNVSHSSSGYYNVSADLLRDPWTPADITNTQPIGYIADDAVWIWNGIDADEITFDFPFGNIMKTTTYSPTTTLTSVSC